MAARHDDGASAPGRVTPVPGDDQAESTLTTIARAALLGIEARSIGPAAWLLRHAHGACIGTVHGHEALAAAVAGFEAARDDVLRLVQQIGGAA